MSWLYYDWLTINGMSWFAALCFVGALILFATVLFELAIAYRISAANLELKIPIVKKEQQDLVVKVIKRRRAFAMWCFFGCLVFELINALGIFGAQMMLIQEANKDKKIVSSTVVTSNSQSLQSSVDKIEASAKEAEAKITSDERTLKTQLRSLYDDEKTRLTSPEWQGWLVKKARREADIQSQRDSEKPLKEKLNALTLQSVDASQTENKETGVIKGTLFQFIAGPNGDPGVVQFIVLSIPSLLLGIIGYGGLAIFLYYKPTKEEEEKKKQ